MKIRGRVQSVNPRSTRCLANRLPFGWHLADIAAWLVSGLSHPNDPEMTLGRLPGEHRHQPRHHLKHVPLVLMVQPQHDQSNGSGAGSACSRLRISGSFCGCLGAGT